VTVAFFAVSVAFVRVCDRVVGQDEPLAAPVVPPAEALAGEGGR
jgi:hypothetical protein